jgi:hypothetical protein
MADPRADNRLKQVPTLVETEAGWELQGFVPLATAWNYPWVKDKKAFIYAFSHKDITKIGRSSCPEKRLEAIKLQWKAPDLKLVHAVEVPYAGSIYAERVMHLEFEEMELSREWFHLPPQEFIDFAPYVEIGAKLYDDACRRWYEEAHPEGDSWYASPITQAETA